MKSHVGRNEAGASIIDVDGQRLDLVFLEEKGETRDGCSLVKESAPVAFAIRLATPVGPLRAA